MTTIESTPKERGLIKGLSKRNRQLNWKVNETELLTKTGLRLLHAAGGDVYQFATEAKLWARTKGKTHIGEYTNKKGVTSLAHFNPNSTYIGSVKKLGINPIDCHYNSPVDRKLHVFNPDKNCFEPRDEEPDMETCSCDGDSYFDGDMEMCSKCNCPHNREYDRQCIKLNAKAVSHCGGGRWRIEEKL